MYLTQNKKKNGIKKEKYNTLKTSSISNTLEKKT